MGIILYYKGSLACSGLFDADKFQRGHGWTRASSFCPSPRSSLQDFFLWSELRQEAYKDHERTNVKKSIHQGSGFVSFSRWFQRPCREVTVLRESKLQRPLHKSCRGVIQFTAVYRVHRTVSRIWRVRGEGKVLLGCCHHVVKIISPEHLALCMRRPARTFVYIRDRNCERNKDGVGQQLPLRCRSMWTKAESLNSKEVRKEKRKFYSL